MATQAPVQSSNKLQRATDKAQEMANENGLSYQVYQQEGGRMVVMVAKPGAEEGGPVLAVVHPQAESEFDVAEPDTDTDADDGDGDGAEVGAIDLPGDEQGAYALGTEAQALGFKMLDCPYAQTSPLHDSWMRGFAEARLNAASTTKAAAPKGKGNEKAIAKEKGKAAPAEPTPMAPLTEDDVETLFGGDGDSMAAAALQADDADLEVDASAPKAKGKAAPAPKAAAKNGTAKPQPVAAQPVAKAPPPPPTPTKGKAAKGQDGSAFSLAHSVGTRTAGSKANRATGTAIGAYQLPAGQGESEWVIVCEDHEFGAFQPSRSAAYNVARTPQDWCPQCQAVAAAQ
jgi:hypothetical protein